MPRSLAVAAVALLIGGCEDEPARPAARRAPPPAVTATPAEPAVTATPGEPAVTATPAAPGPAAWPSYEGPGFTVRHPRTPRTTTQDVPTEAGTMTMTAYTFQAPGSDVASAVMVTPLLEVAKDVDQAKMIRDAREGMVRKYGATLDRERAITLGATPALDFSAHGDHPKLGAFFLRGRVAIHSNQLFQVLVVGAGHAEIPEAGRFVESFALR